MIPSWARRAAHVLLLAVLLTPGTAAASPIASPVVTVISPAAIDAVMVVGIAKGIFEKYGLRIQTRIVANGFDAVKQVADGNAQIAAAAGTAVAQSIGWGVRLKAVVVTNGDATGSVPTDSYVAVIGRAASGLREGHLEDLQGKKVVVRRGSDFHQYLFAGLATKGLDPVAAVTILDAVAAVAIAPAIAPAVDPGRVLGSGFADAVVMPEPGASRILRATSGAVVVQRGGNFMQFLELRAVAAGYLATHPGTIKRYVTGFAEAAQFMRMHPDEAADIMIREQFPGVPRDFVRAAIGLLHADVRISKVTAQAAQAGADFAIRIGALGRAPAFDEMFDPRILRQVEREHPEFFSDLAPIPNASKL